ncbi:cell wall-active antibiotic response 4TMS protein YvqF [Actinocorallia herbida]|uniref:Cell wall-active antibiotic response 4TMS protein YvqF n=1 Tax=Actinocorallia herbida TaxID=58109 RepID=A0A3N1CNE5_9ACTN|nr:DUF1707 domain-containing protein [Actinocorallia herbida]ROO82822.1 cell wall-active antibiotic response 4TMS protein YvqF [Actinocorallia herbida]
MDSDRSVPARDLRASDADRDRVADLLRDAVEDGRLTPDEHAERVEGVFAARTLGELTMFTKDLLPQNEQPFQVDARQMVALFGSHRQDGRWVVPARLPVAAVFGKVEIDLREAILRHRHVVLDLSSLFGRIRLHVPGEVVVRFTGRSMAGSVKEAVPAWPPTDGEAPVVELTGTLLLGAVEVIRPKRPKPPRRSFWAGRSGA